MKTCPACAEEIQEAARVCRFCGYDFKLKRNPQLGKSDLAGCALSGCAVWLFWPFLAIALLAIIGTFIGNSRTYPDASATLSSGERDIDQEALNTVSPAPAGPGQ